MSVVYLSLEEVGVLCQKLGGLKIRDLGLLDSALHRPQSGFAGVEAYPTIPLKAAALLHSIAKNHSLLDGNKRLAWMACGVFLVSNGFRSSLSHDEAIEFMVAVATGDRDMAIEDIADGLRVVDDVVLSEMEARLHANPDLLARIEESQAHPERRRGRPKRP